MQNKDRPEPELGRLDDIDPTDRRPAARRPAQQARARRRADGARLGVWLFAALILAALAAVYVMRDELRQHFPGSQTRELLNAGARAESEGRWRGDVHGNDALS